MREGQASPAAARISSTSWPQPIRRAGHRLIARHDYVGGGAYQPPRRHHAAGPSAYPGRPTAERGKQRAERCRCSTCTARYLRIPAAPGAAAAASSAGAGYVLHDVDKMAMLVACHGYESPTSRGLFGGYPSACNRRRLLKNTERSTESWRTERCRPASTSCRAKSTRSTPSRRCSSSARTMPTSGARRRAAVGAIRSSAMPEQVVEDVRLNAVSEGAARSIYGVALNPDGTLEATARKACGRARAASGWAGRSRNAWRRPSMHGMARSSRSWRSRRFVRAGRHGSISAAAVRR